MPWNVPNYAHWECNKAVIATRGSDGITVSRVECFVTKTAIRTDGFRELYGISFICGSKVLWSVLSKKCNIKIKYSWKSVQLFAKAGGFFLFCFVCFLLYLGGLCTIFICFPGIQICRRWWLKWCNIVCVDILIWLVLGIFIFLLKVR